jgi:hypothetical protein
VRISSGPENTPRHVFTIGRIYGSTTLYSISSTDLDRTEENRKSPTGDLVEYCLDGSGASIYGYVNTVLIVHVIFIAKHNLAIIPSLDNMLWNASR